MCVNTVYSHHQSHSPRDLVSRAVKLLVYQVLFRDGRADDSGWFGRNVLFFVASKFPAQSSFIGCDDRTERIVTSITFLYRRLGNADGLPGNGFQGSACRSEDRGGAVRSPVSTLKKDHTSCCSPVSGELGCSSWGWFVPGDRNLRGEWAQAVITGSPLSQV